MVFHYKGTSLKINRPHLGPYSRPMPRFLRWSHGGVFLMSEVLLYVHFKRMSSFAGCKHGCSSHIRICTVPLAAPSDFVLRPAGFVSRSDLSSSQARADKRMVLHHIH